MDFSSYEGVLSYRRFGAPNGPTPLWPTIHYTPTFTFHPDSLLDSSDFYGPQGTGLFDNDPTTSLARRDKYVWSTPNCSPLSASHYNSSFAFHPDSFFYLSKFYPPQGTGLSEVFGAKADDDISAHGSDEHVGGGSVNISDTGIVSEPPADGGLNKPFGGCEQFSGGGQEWCLARDSCGSACDMCGEAEHFATRCSLGLDADCEINHSGRDSS